MAQLDPYKAAENSPFNKVSPTPKLKEAQAPGAQKPGTRPAFKTMSDI